MEIELWFDDYDEYYKTNNIPMTCFLNVNNVCSAATELEPLSAPQATFEHVYDGLTFTRVSPWFGTIGLPGRKHPYQLRNNTTLNPRPMTVVVLMVVHMVVHTVVHLGLQIAAIVHFRI